MVLEHVGMPQPGDCRVVFSASAEELEAACRKCLRAEVDNINSLSVALDEMQVEYNVVSQTKADIFCNMSMTKLVTELAERGCQVISASEKDESLESYFISLVGGEEHE